MSGWWPGARPRASVCGCVYACLWVHCAHVLVCKCVCTCVFVLVWATLVCVQVCVFSSVYAVVCVDSMEALAGPVGRGTQQLLTKELGEPLEPSSEATWHPKSLVGRTRRQDEHGPHPPHQCQTARNPPQFRWLLGWRGELFEWQFGSELTTFKAGSD